MTQYVMRRGKPWEGYDFRALSDQPAYEGGGSVRRGAEINLGRGSEITNPDPRAGEEMFANDPGEVYAAFSDRSMRHTVPTLLALAEQFHQRNYGGQPEARMDDLSPHSAKLVQRLGERGVAPKLEPTVKNQWDFGDNVYDADEAGFEPLSREDVTLARARVREMVGRPKAPRQPVGAQFNQTQLF